MSPEELIEVFRSKWNTPGCRFSFLTKVTKYVANGNVRKLRTIFACLQVAFPETKIKNLVDPEILRDSGKVLKPYYTYNKSWKPEQGIWGVFTKISEPPE